jgi:acyl-CoA thioesterase-2
MSRAPTPEQMVADLVLLLDMEPRGTDRFEGRRRKSSSSRVYGGQVIAQAVAAAELTVPDDRAAHSLHCYFLRGGNSEFPIDYRILRDFDGGSISNRRVTACQNGEVILNMTASFQKRLDGLAHQAMTLPDVPAPEDLEEDYLRRRPLAERTGLQLNPWLLQPTAIDWRSVELENRFSVVPTEPVYHSWFRTRARLPDDPRVHRAVLAYASDMVLLGTASMPHEYALGTPQLMGATIDHSIWFHEDFRADEWLLFRSESPWAGRSRGFTRGSIFARDGRLVASVAQEGMLRRMDLG